MDHAAGRRGAEDRLPGGSLKPPIRAPRKLLRRAPRLAWGVGKDITLCGALAAALPGEDEERDARYDLVAGGSGIAFQLRIDDRWDPSTVSPHDPSVIHAAARSASLRADVVEPPFDDELRALVWERVVECIDADLPPLARGLLGLPEFGVITGYGEGHVLFARTYGERSDESSRVLADEAFVGDAAATIVFLDRGEGTDEARLARDAIRRGAEVSASTSAELDGARLYAGEAAFAAWIEGLLADVPPREAAQRAFVDHARRVFLHDARRTAARFLRRVRRHFPDRVGAELVRAAEAYAYVADEVEKGGVRPFDASVVARFQDPSIRRGWAYGLERALVREREAIAALRGAAAQAA